MNQNELNSLIKEIDESIDKQISLISIQITELKNHIFTVEKLLKQIKEENPA